MKYYTLETINNGKIEKINKKFDTRDQAIDYAFAYFEDKTYNDSLQVEDVYSIRNDKHNIEYVLDYYNRFRVNRVLTGA